MKNYFSWLVILLITLMLLFGIEVTSRCKDVEVQLQTERFLREQKELEYEKDVYALRYWYEGEEGEDK